MIRYKTKTVGYIRCSTNEQAVSGLGIEAQRQQIKGYCGYKGHTLVDIFADEGVSGATSMHKRPGGRALITSLEQLVKTRGCKKYTISVAISRLDRAFRSTHNCLETLAKWERRGISLNIIDLGGSDVDTTSSSGKFLLTVLAAAAEMERNLIGERVKAAFKVKKDRGERYTRIPPYGKCMDPDDPTRLIEHERERVVIDLMLDWRAEGVSYRNICKELIDQGYFPRSGNEWQLSIVHNIIKREGC